MLVESNNSEENRFKTISEFKRCINHGGEVTFSYNNKEYGIFKSNQELFIISEIGNDNTEKAYGTADTVLDYIIESDKLRDIITKVKVIDRTI
jgi:hypothetical protein